MKKILLYGATGRTGELVLKLALDKGYSITALVRNPNKLNFVHNNLTVIKGLPTVSQDIERAILNCDVVINTLSALSEKESMSFKKIDAPHTLEKMMHYTIESMLKYNVKRIITLSSIGVGDSWKYAPWFMKLFIKISNFKIVFTDHNAQEQLLRNSTLDWIILRPVGLNNSTDLKNLVVNYAKTPSPFKMSRLQLATFIVNNIESDNFIGKAPILSEK
ncbi:NAD(P)-dependent oxidoreductase [Flavobacterium sp. J27]|uniref:NAD(P)-dependent oxidoreductase n=1 Tax=Flavobacterium sp. J27 TaxID=2060419 RepID=UPI00102F6F32|nr:NAD(P)-binding oxidoreductase [Flavobacterium sp. J27]